MAGRPSKYTPELASDICAGIIEGKSIREICKADDMPDAATVFRWLAAEKGDFCKQYTRAKEIQAEVMSEELLEIADDAQNDYMIRRQEGGDLDDNHGWVTNGEAIQRSRLRIESRKWLMGKMKPKKYGEKQTIDHTTKGEKLPGPGLTDEQLMAIAKGIK